MPCPTFGIWQRKKPEVLKYWYVPVENFETSSQEFHAGIEQTLQAMDLPGVEVSRIEFAEGGLLSAQREYMRLRRERFVFDICSAPFGSGWFFSCRLSEIRVTLMLWELIVILAALAGIGFGYVHLFGPLWGGIIAGVSVLGIFFLMRNAVTLGLHDFDAWILPVPVLGALYELLRKETYFRIDTRVMFQDVVDRVVRAKVEEVTGAKGIQPVVFKEIVPDAHPVLADLIRHLRS